MSVAVRLLGTVEADLDGRTVDLGPARQRCVLSVLLVEANHVVPVDTLLHRIWGDRQPYRARGTLYSYISRLRNAFAGTDELHIEHRSGGYQLTTEASAIDVHRFRALLTAARAERRPGEAAENFAAALALWRGEPFAALDTGWLNEVREALEAQRRAAELDRNDLALRLGRHANLLGEMRQHAADRPLDERLTGQLMLALYRSGRQAEALDVYQATRNTLVDELGLEPGPELRSLQQRILAGDQALSNPPGEDTDASPPSWKPFPVPRQLPAPATTLVGRDEALATLHGMLGRVRASEPVTVAVDGTAGVGKTALAVHFGHQVAEGFPDGQLYVDLRGDATGSPMTPTDALGALLRGLGMAAERTPTREAELASTYRSMLAGRRVLIVLDNASGAAQVQPLLPGTPGCLVLITSRPTLSTVDGIWPLHLDVLPERDALALLEHATGTERVRAEPEAAATVVRRCAGLPLAIRIAGARLAARPSWTVATLAGRLGDQHGRLDELRMGDVAVRASFAVSYQALRAGLDGVDPLAAKVFRLLGVLDWMDVSVPVAAALLDVPQPAAQLALERLVDDHLLESGDPQRYYAHDLLRLYCRELAHEELSANDRRAGLLRALRCYVAGAQHANLLFNPNTRHDAEPISAPQGGFGLHTTANAAEWTDAEHANLYAVAQHSFPIEPALTLLLTMALARPFDLRGHWNELLALRISAATTARQLNDRTAEAFALQDVGWTYVRLGHSAQDAVQNTRQALRIWRKLGDARSEQACLNVLGFAYRQQQCYREAVDCLERALAICARIGHRCGEATTRDHLGLVYQRLNRFDDAINCHLRSLTVNREIGHRYGEAIALGNMGWTHLRGGNPEQAIECHQQSVTLARELGDRYQEAEALWGLGQAQRTLSQFEAARAYWDRSIAILCAIGALTTQQAAQVRATPTPDTPDIIERNT